eukprot:gene3556-biopygen12100
MWEELGKGEPTWVGGAGKCGGVQGISSTQPGHLRMREGWGGIRPTALHLVLPGRLRNQGVGKYRSLIKYFRNPS